MQIMLLKHPFFWEIDTNTRRLFQTFFGIIHHYVGKISNLTVAYFSDGLVQKPTRTHVFLAKDLPLDNQDLEERLPGEALKRFMHWDAQPPPLHGCLHLSIHSWLFRHQRSVVGSVVG